MKSAQEEILEILRAPDFLDRLKDVPPRRVIRALFWAIGSPEEQIKWPAVTAMGIVVAQMARKDPEAARQIIRRLLWSLNDESGSIGWGAPESLGEILARSDFLAEEYAPILVSYMRPDGSYLEYEMLQRGLMWALARLAEVKPKLLQFHRATQYLQPYLKSSDAEVRGLAVRALGFLGNEKDLFGLKLFLQDESEIKIYREKALKTYRIADLAKEAMDRLSAKDKGPDR